MPHRFLTDLLLSVMEKIREKMTSDGLQATINNADKNHRWWIDKTLKIKKVDLFDAKKRNELTSSFLECFN